MPQTDAVVIYHANCTDGFGAAWAFHKLREPAYHKVHYIPAAYGQTPPPVTADQDVYVLDFSYPLDQMLKIAESCATLWLLDHHKSAKPLVQALRAVQNCIVSYHEEKSGAGIVWDTFGSALARPLLISLIEDRDLWQWRLPDSRALNAVVGATDHEFAAFDALSRMLRELLPLAITSGKLLLKQTAKYVKDITRNAAPIAILGYEGYLCQCPGILASDTADALAAPAILYFTTPEGKVKISIRAPKNCSLNVREIAERFGGGGHDKAAGFTVSEADFLSPWFWETLEGKRVS